MVEVTDLAFTEIKAAMFFMEDDVLTACLHMYSQLLECYITWQYVFGLLDAVTCLNMVLIG